MNITDINTQTNLTQLANRNPGSNELGKDAFLQMLVTQLRNQDPTNPLDSSQFAAQLAQFNTLEQLINLNDQFETMTLQNELIGTGLNNTLAASLTGKVVRVQSDLIGVDGGTAPAVNFNLSGSASNVEIQILDQNGRVIKTEKLTNLNSGDHSWEWNGKSDSGVKAPDGAYQIRINASNGDAPVNSSVFSEGVATRVRYTENGVQLQVNGIFVNLASIEEIGEPGG